MKREEHKSPNKVMFPAVQFRQHCYSCEASGVSFTSSLKLGLHRRVADCNSNDYGRLKQLTGMECNATPKCKASHS